MKYPLMAMSLVAGLFATAGIFSAEPLVRHDVVGLRLDLKAPQPLVDDYFDPSAGRAVSMVLRVTVASNGKVKEAHAGEGFYTTGQGRRAEKFAKYLAFTPKTIDGKPVESSGELPIRYWFPASENVSPAVQDSLKEAARHISARNWSAALERLDRMVANEISSISSFMVTEYLRVAVYEGMGDTEQALRHARLALRCWLAGGTSLRRECPAPVAMVSQTLIRAIGLESRLGRYAEALDDWDTLQAFDKQSATSDLADEVAKVRTLIASGDPVTTWLVMDAAGEGHADLFRLSLAVDSVEGGALDEASLECKSADAAPGHRDGYELPLAERSWSIPSTASGCTLILRGKSGTRVKIVQSGNPMPAA